MDPLIDETPAEEAIPRVVIRLLPALLAGQPPQIEVKYFNCPGEWPMVVGLLIQGLSPATLKAFDQLTADQPRILPANGMPRHSP